jgi:hypothetical protein
MGIPSPYPSPKGRGDSLPPAGEGQGMTKKMEHSLNPLDRPTKVFDTGPTYIFRPTAAAR